MSNGFPIDIYSRANREANLYADAYTTALARIDPKEVTPDAMARHADAVARAAVRNFRSFLVNEGYTDLHETTD